MTTEINPFLPQEKMKDSDETLEEASEAPCEDNQPVLEQSRMPPSRLKPNHSRRFSRSGLNLGISISDAPGTETTQSPMVERRSSMYHSVSANNSPVISNGFNSTRRSMSLKRSSSLYHSNPSTPHMNKGFNLMRPGSTVGRSMLTSSSMKSLNDVSSDHTVVEASSVPNTPMEETGEKLRMLAVKERRVVELNDQIRSLTAILEKEKKELVEIRQSVQTELYTNLASPQRQTSQATKSPQLAALEKLNGRARTRTNSLLGGVFSGPEATVQQKLQEESPSNKRLSMWDSLSKPLNLISQFDNMLQSEFEKISSGNAPGAQDQEAKSRLSPPKRSPKRSPQKLIDDADDLFSWGDHEDNEKTPSKPARQKNKLVLGKSEKLDKSSSGLRLSRQPSYRKPVKDHKIILPKRNSEGFKGLFDESKTEANGINNPILDLADNKNPKDSLQTVSSSLWNFYSDVKDGLLLSIEEERAGLDAQQRNAHVDLIDMDSSPEKDRELRKQQYKEVLKKDT